MCELIEYILKFMHLISCTKLMRECYNWIWICQLNCLLCWIWPSKRHKRASSMKPHMCIYFPYSPLFVACGKIHYLVGISSYFLFGILPHRLLFILFHCHQLHHLPVHLQFVIFIGTIPPFLLNSRCIHNLVPEYLRASGPLGDTSQTNRFANRLQTLTLHKPT